MSVRIQVQQDDASESLRYVATATLEGDRLHEVAVYGGSEAEDEAFRKMSVWLRQNGYPRPDWLLDQSLPSWDREVDLDVRARFLTGGPSIVSVQTALGRCLSVGFSAASADVEYPPHASLCLTVLHCQVPSIPGRKPATSRRPSAATRRGLPNCCAIERRAIARAASPASRALENRQWRA